MILYSVVTTYHLLEAMVHKLGHRKNKDGILMISHWLQDKYEWYQELEQIFKKVIVFNANYSYSDQIQKDLNTYFTPLLDKSNLNLKEFEEIHVFGAEHSFGAYVTVNELPFLYWEEGAGALSKKDSMLELFLKAYGEKKAQFQYENHLGDGEGNFVLKRYYNRYFQEKEIEGNNLNHFDLAEELIQLPQKDRDSITFLFYRDKKIEPGSHTALILTEHFANLSAMSWEEQIYLYKYIIDYFLEGYELLFKPHPDDIMYYEYLFPDSNVIRKRFPAELLPFIFTKQPEAVATSSSTSIYGLRKQFQKVVEFNFTFSHKKQFYLLNRYFTALTIADQYVKKGYPIKLLGVNPAFVENFYHSYHLCTEQYKCYSSAEELLTKDKKAAVWLIDEVQNPHIDSVHICEFLTQLPSKSIVIFINSDAGYCFYHHEKKQLWKDIQPIEIETKALSGVDTSVNFAGPQINEEQKEEIYVYCRGEKVKMYGLKKELPNVGITVTAKEFDGDKMQIKLLEGMLEATEKRLLYYVAREKELLEQVEKA